MEYLQLLVLICGGIVVIYYAVRGQSPTAKQGAASQQKVATTHPPDTPLQVALRQLSAVIKTCQDDHPHALPALLFMAASDGTVSRQELRIIIGFCERQGSIFAQPWTDACEHLNAGLNISINGGEAGARDNINDISDHPIKYRAAFCGAAEAIIASNRTTNAAKQRLIEQTRSLI